MQLGLSAGQDSNSTGLPGSAMQNERTWTHLAGCGGHSPQAYLGVLPGTDPALPNVQGAYS